MYCGAPTCRDDRCEGIFPSAAPEHHLVPSPPTATSDEPGTGTDMVLDATTVSQLKAMLDEPEVDAGTAPDASPAMELQLLQSPEPEQTTLTRDTLLAEQAEHSPRVESLPQRPCHWSRLSLVTPRKHHHCHPESLSSSLKRQMTGTMSPKWVPPPMP